MPGERGPDTGRVQAKHHDPGLQVERLERLEDTDDEWPAAKVEQRLRRAHALGASGGEHYAGE